MARIHADTPADLGFRLPVSRGILAGKSGTGWRDNANPVPWHLSDVTGRHPMPDSITCREDPGNPPRRDVWQAMR